MTIELALDRTAAVAQTVHIRSHELLADVSPDNGGADSGPSPHDLYDAALGACKALAVVRYARKNGIDVNDVQTSVERDDSARNDGVYRLAATVKVHGELTDAQLQELRSVAQQCPLDQLMSSGMTEITTEVERMA